MSMLLIRVILLGYTQPIVSCSHEGTPTLLISVVSSTTIIYLFLRTSHTNAPSSGSFHGLFTNYSAVTIIRHEVTSLSILLFLVA